QRRHQGRQTASCKQAPRLRRRRCAGVNEHWSTRLNLHAGSPFLAHDLLYVGSWAISNPKTPGFAPPPHDELALFDNLGIGSHPPTLEGESCVWRFRTGFAPEAVRPARFERTAQPMTLPGLKIPFGSSAFLIARI